jgi:DNA modification methylase
MLGRAYIGFEIVKDYYDFARRRLDEGIYRIKADEPVWAELHAAGL